MKSSEPVESSNTKAPHELTVFTTSPDIVIDYNSWYIQFNAINTGSYPYHI